MRFSIQQKLKFAFFSSLAFTATLAVITLISGEQIKPGSLLIQFLLFGLLFGFGYLYFLEFMSRKLMKKISVLLEDEELLLKEGPAYLMQGQKEESGKMVLTDKRLIFKTLRMVQSENQISITLSQLSKVEGRKTSKAFQNGIFLETIQSKQYTFALYHRDEWLDLLTSTNE